MALRHELPFNVDDLLNARVVESNRVEFKASWNDVVRKAVLRSVCAFANDILNLNGGYIVLGVEEQDGRAVLPPVGLPTDSLDRVQKEVFRACKECITPEYQPMICVEHVGDRPIIVLCCPGGEARPYAVQEGKGAKNIPYVRHGAVSAQAEGESLRQLLSLAARVPFDDRRNMEARVEDLSPTLARRFLHLVGSQLIDENIDDRELLQRLRVIAPMNGHGAPRNVGLLFFSNDPDRYLPGARVEVVRHGQGGDLLDERVFRGPLNEQVEGALRAMDDLTGLLIRKLPAWLEAQHNRPYPPEALREALINAVYHRGYDGPPEPVKVYLYPDRVEIISYPGPLPGLRREHLGSTGPRAVLPARNRRVGEFLKELHLAEARGTGIPKIWQRLRDNGSPPPEFDFDEERTYFRTTIYPHRDFVLEAEWLLYFDGQQEAALDLLFQAADRDPSDAAIAEALIARFCTNNRISDAVAVLERYKDAAQAERRELRPGPFLALASAFNAQRRTAEALALLVDMPPSTWKSQPVRYASALRRADDLSGALAIFGWIHSNVEQLDLTSRLEYGLYWLEAAEAWSTVSEQFRGTAREQALCEAMGLLEQMFDDRKLMAQASAKPWLSPQFARAQQLYEDILRQLKLPLPYRPGSSPWSGRT